MLANDTDTDGGAKTIARPRSGERHGGAAGRRAHGADLRAGPRTTARGADTFTYTLNGGSTATVSVDGHVRRRAPTAVDDGATVPEDSAASPIDVLANDTDVDGDPKTIASASDPANGTVV